MPTAALGTGMQVGMVSRPGKVRPLWSRDYVRTGSERWLRGYIWSGLMCLETQGPRGGRWTLDLGDAAEGLTHGRLASAHISRFHAGHAGGGGLRRGAYRMGVQAETWGWALGQPMGLRWGVQGVDRASKRRGRAPVGSVR